MQSFQFNMYFSLIYWMFMRNAYIGQIVLCINNKLSYVSSSWDGLNCYYRDILRCFEVTASPQTQYLNTKNGNITLEFVVVKWETCAHLHCFWRKPFIRGSFDDYPSLEVHLKFWYGQTSDSVGKRFLWEKFVQERTISPNFHCACHWCSKREFLERVYVSWILTLNFNK